MGLADYLYQRGLHFEHKDTPKVVDRLFADIKQYAIEASMELANKDGVYDSWQGSRWQQEGLRLRNSHLLAIAPTATISAIAGCYPSIEPPYSNYVNKSLDKSEIAVLNKHLLAEAKKYGNFISEKILMEHNGSVQNIYIPEAYSFLKEKYKTAFEIDQFKLIDLASIRQKYICQSQSLNLFIPPDKASGKYISDLYMHAWKKGIKTTYYLHTQPASFIAKSCEVCSM